ncbi:MAG TPA: hypothetical protein VMV92_26500 [Streptosporangiaceae bacterium]|nr:hypothetical protein [Streptosporangiaceae bacterium]
MTTPGPDSPARTAILTVDDDPGVSRAIARDLRQRYAEQHRIVRAESCPAAGRPGSARPSTARPRD